MQTYPYHEGELAMQTRAHVSEQANKSANAIAEQIPERAIPFIAQQAMLVIGSMDAEGHIWTTVLFGQPGFIRASGRQQLELNLALAGTSGEDPVWSHLDTHRQVGLLFIELVTRRRLRVNGRIYKRDAQRYQISVEQAYPNCPKYIQRRFLKTTNWQVRHAGTPMIRGSRLNTDQMAMLARSDTFFVASAHPEHGIDASHRGGRAGFVEILDSMLLRIPDYIGNNMFNTLGNFQIYPHAGLAFIDFDTNRLLQLSGEVEILWPLDDPTQLSGGTQRFWQFRIRAWRESRIPFDLEWELLDHSSFNPQPLAAK